MNKKNIIDTITEKIKQTDRNFSLLSDRNHILVGLSGGADSCALLLALLSLKSEYGYELSAVHVNHGIRGKEAERDEEFSVKLCEAKGIKCFCKHIDVPSIVKSSGLSLETAARNARYEIFEMICTDNNIDCIATAHTASDNVETVLFNLIRGCSLNGVCGIPVKRLLGNTNVEIIRPLIYASRWEIEEYLGVLSQDYVTDSTNFEVDCSRNYIRHELVPKIKKLNPSIETALCSFTTNAAYDKEYIESQVKEHYTNEIDKIYNMPYSLKTRIVKELYDNVSCGEMLENSHIQTIISEIEACLNNKMASSVSLPGKIKAVIRNGKLYFEEDCRNKDKSCDDYDVALKEGINVIPESDFLICVSSSENVFPDVIKYMENIYKKYNTAFLYSDKIFSNIHARNRKQSDEFKFKGMNRKVKKLLSKAELSCRERNAIPFIAEGKNIIYIPGIGVCDEYAFDNKNKEHIMNIAIYMISD